MHCTIILSIRPDSSKLTSFIIFKRRTASKGVKSPTEMNVQFQEKGQMVEKQINKTKKKLPVEK